jgi:hypothetical protein
MHEASALYKLQFDAGSLLVSTLQTGQGMKMWAQMKCSLTGLPGYLYYDLYIQALINILCSDSSRGQNLQADWSNAVAS